MECSSCFYIGVIGNKRVCGAGREVDTYEVRCPSYGKRGKEYLSIEMGRNYYLTHGNCIKPKQVYLPTPKYLDTNDTWDAIPICFPSLLHIACSSEEESIRVELVMNEYTLIAPYSMGEYLRNLYRRLGYSCRWKVRHSFPLAFYTLYIKI
jgi:hypothetical protein